MKIVEELGKYMDTTIKERLLAFIKAKGLSQRKFELSVGLSNGYVNNISKGIGAEKLQRIVEKYPDINQSWLMTGEGEMLLPTDGTAKDSIFIEMVKQKDKILREQAMEIGRQIERIRMLCGLTEQGATTETN